MIPRSIQQVLHMYKLFCYIFVFEGDHAFFSSPDFVCPRKFIISCFCHILDFLAIFRHLTEHKTSTPYVLHIIHSDTIVNPKLNDL